MDSGAIKSRLTGVFRQVFDNDAIEIGDSTTAADIPQWDSITHIDLVLAVEKAFAIRLTTREVRSMQNVGDLIALIAKKSP